jgi:hypothetical protein
MTPDQDHQMFKQLQFLAELERRMLAAEQQATVASRANVKATIALAIAPISMIVAVVSIWMR